MGKIKDIMIEAEGILFDMLNVKGATNEQALVVIESELGKLAKDHAEDVLRKWNEEVS